MSGDIFPSITPEKASDNGDPVFDREELESMDYEELRALAAQVETDAINGKSTKLEMIDYFATHQVSLEDYGTDD